MIQQLKKLFPSLLTIEETQYLHTDYKWYISADQQIIGILKEELTEKDQAILATFLQPYEQTFPLQTEKERKWSQMIYADKPNSNKLDCKMYRFIHFYTEYNQIDPVTFKEAIEQLFTTEVAIIWENKHAGIIIEEISKYEDAIDYTKIIDILMSDLYVKIQMFIGEFRESLKGIKDYFRSITESAKIAKTYTKKPVTTYLDVIPYLLIAQTSQSIQRELRSILKQFQHDDETLKMIETFLDCNLNISETAKHLYMHRNSLQYRLDRFAEITNIDIRKFHQAMAVYLALITIKYNSL